MLLNYFTYKSNGAKGTHWPRVACVVWSVLVFLAIGRTVFHYSSSHIGCYDVFAQAGRHWLAGQTLYDVHNPNFMELFRYSPLVAAGLTPLALVADPLGNALLRLLNLAVFVPGLWWWAKTAMPSPMSARHHALLFLLVAGWSARRSCALVWANAARREAARCVLLTRQRVRSCTARAAGPTRFAWHLPGK